MAADFESSHISSRMRDTILSISPRIDAALATKSACIDLATAENWLLRSELRNIYSASIAGHIKEKTLSYPGSILGDTEMLAAFADFFGTYFRPRTEVTPSQVVVAPGATHCLDALLTTICDEGDSVLVPVPHWNGFAVHFQLRPRINIVPVVPEWTAGRLDGASRPLAESLVPALRRAMDDATDRTRIKALVMTNPNNPLGQCYPQGVLQEALDFCRDAGLHYISDELYALSQLGTGSGFVSALSLDTRRRPSEGAMAVTSGSDSNDNSATAPTTSWDVQNINMNGKRRRDESPSAATPRRAKLQDQGRPDALLHVIWSTSKDLSSSGVRIAALVSQSREAGLILKSVGLLSSMHVSSLSSLATTHLLHSPAFPGLVATLSRRLARAHAVAHARFRRWAVPFFPADAGPFVVVRLGPRAVGTDVMARLRSAQVTVAEAHSFGGGWCDGDDGFWVRLTVSVPPTVLWDGLNQIGFALGYT